MVQRFSWEYIFIVFGKIYKIMFCELHSGKNISFPSVLFTIYKEIYIFLYTDAIFSQAITGRFISSIPNVVVFKSWKFKSLGDLIIMTLTSPLVCLEILKDDFAKHDVHDRTWYLISLRLFICLYCKTSNVIIAYTSITFFTSWYHWH